MAAVELSTVTASKNIRALRDEIKGLAKELGASSQQINFISKSMTGAAQAVTKFGSKIKTLESKLTRLTATNNRLVAQQKKAAASNAMSTQMARQAKMATQAELKFERLRTQIKQLNLERQQEASMLASLTSSYNAFNRRLRSGVQSRKQLLVAEEKWQRVSGKTSNAISGIKTKKTNAGLSRMSEIMRDLGSSAVLAIGPLSGLGAKILAFSAIAARSGFAIAALAGALTALTIGFIKTFSASVKAGLQLNKIMGTLRAGTGSMAQASKEFAFISKITEDLGLNLAESGRQFAKLSAAARGTSLEGQGVRDIFEGVSIAATAMQLSTEQSTGALRAIEQMISKGNVQAEELRGQLGERLPGAFQLAARAMGVTTQELNKMLEQGEVLAEDMLPKLAKVLKEAFSEEAAVAAGKLAFQMERFKTEVFESLVVIERWLDSMGASVKIVRNVNDAMDDFNTESMDETFIRLQKNLRESSKEMHRLVTDGEGVANLLKDEFGDVRGAEKFERQLKNAFTDSKLAASEFFAFVDENRERLESMGFTIPVRFITQGQDPTAARTAAKGGPGQMPGPQLRNFMEFESPDKLKDLREDLEEIGGSDLEKGLLSLDRQLKDVVESINKMELPKDLPDDMRKTFEAFKGEKIREATAATKELKEELRRLAAEEAGKKLKETFEDLAKSISEVEGKIAVTKARLAGNEEVADELERQQAALASFEGLELKDLAVILEKERTLALLTESLKLQTKEMKEQEKLREKALKDREKLEAKLATSVEKLKAENEILQLRIAGENELANAMETRLKLAKEFKGFTAGELAELEKLTNKNKELTEVLKEQTEAQKEAKKLAQDFSKVIGTAFEDAIIAGKSLSDVLQGLLDDINRIVLRLLVTKPLENFLTGAITGEDPTGSKAGPGGTPFFGGLLGKLIAGEKRGGSSESPTGAPGPHGGVSEATKAATIQLNKMAESSAGVNVESKSLESRLIGLTSSKIAERVTTVTLTNALLDFQIAVRLATQALNSMAAGGGASAAGGGFAGIALGSLTNSVGGAGSFGGSNPFEAGFSGNPHFHQGGKVRKPSNQNVPGLRSDEVLGVLQTGEEVVPRGGQASSGGNVINLTQNIQTDNVPEFRRSARSNLRVGAKAAKSAFRRI